MDHTANTLEQTHIALRGVSLVYGEAEQQTLAVDRLEMDIAPGEFVAVVGPSGCGKSTLMKLVTGLLLPDAGAVFVHGQEVHKPVAGVGMAFQNATLMPWRTTLRNIMLPLEVVAPHKHELTSRRAHYEAMAEALLETVGLGGAGKKVPWELSGGMQQRANLCRALIHQPELLMLDEPFGALDAFTREELWSVLQNLWIGRRFTTILVTHDLREAVYLADTVHVMGPRPGRIVLSRRVPFARPRTLADTYHPDFVALVQELRDCIQDSRSAIGTTP